MIQFDNPCVSHIEMAEVTAIDGIRMNRNGLVRMHFGTVVVPVATMFVSSRQVRMRR